MARVVGSREVSLGTCIFCDGPTCALEFRAIRADIEEC